LDGLARYARVLTGDRQQAHDVLADALVQATLKWKRIGTFEFPAAYVRRMVTSRFLGERRRWSARHIQPVASPPERPTADPTAAVDDRAALQAALATLPRQQRAAVVLRFYLDLPDHEIAGELGCSAGAVRSYVSRGLAALRISGVDDGQASAATSREAPAPPQPAIASQPRATRDPSATAEPHERSGAPRPVRGPSDRPASAREQS
jgi:RNA polymerase sigma-70 factor (sigma-E family)